MKKYGLKWKAYFANQTIYTDYGEYRGDARFGWDYKRTRDWPRGDRSPYRVTLTVFPKNPNISHDEFLKRWFGIQSPMSEIIQPRARYVRNEVIRSVHSSEPPDFDGFVVEAWPSDKHQNNLFLFFNANNPWDLCINVSAMLRSLLGFASFTQIQGGSYIEYQFE